jgi:hypothetical protein
MKKTLIIASVLALGAIASQAQGLVSISLGGGTLVNTNTGAGLGNIQPGQVGKAYGSGTAGFYYELLVSSTAQPDLTASGTSLGNWLDTGVFGTSGISALQGGKITSGASVTANNWPAPSGATEDDQRFVEIVGWSGNYGTTFSAFLTSYQAGLANGGYFGVEGGQNVAGGGPSGLPSVNQWGNQTGANGLGFNSGLVLNLVNTPEPASMVLAGLGGLSLLALRRKK